MAATTPIYALPYPTGTDRVMDGDNAMGALAGAVDAALGRISAGMTFLAADYVLTGTATLMPSTRYDATITDREIWVVTAVWDITVSVAAAGIYAVGTAVVDGNVLPQLTACDMNAVNRSSLTLVHVTGILPAGAHYVTMRAGKTAGTATATANQSNTRMTILRIPVGANVSAAEIKPAAAVSDE